jgi:zinc D-Ala-D-Ala dipeptidase
MAHNMMVLLWLLACSGDSQEVAATPIPVPVAEPDPVPTPPPVEEAADPWDLPRDHWLNEPPEGWRDLRDIGGVQVDIRYHTADNFTGAPLPGYGAPGAWLLEEPARALEQINATLAKDGYLLLVYDAYRPLRGTKGMVAWAERTDQVHLLDNGYIARRSNHNRGNTVDLTLVNEDDKTPVDMGTPWDTLSADSHTKNASGQALENRMRLKAAMEKGGFKNYWKEWWHFQFEGIDPKPAHRDVPYGCFEVAEGAWSASDGWNVPGYEMPMTWPRRPQCEGLSP